MPDWKALLIGGLGGGAVYELTDRIVGGMLPGQIAGMSMKDLLLIIGSGWYSDKVTGDFKTLLQGMCMIGLYKVIYPQFISPMIAGLGFGVAAAPAATSSPSPSPPVSIEQLALMESMR